MDNILNNLTAVITVLIGFVVIRKITGLFFKLAFGALIIGFLYYVYNGGSLEVVNNFIGGF